MAGERDAGSSNPTRTASGFAGARPSAAADEFGVISERIVPSSRSPSSRAPASSPSSPPVDSDTPSDGANEEFLFHLYRGSELLQDNRVREAKEELERALGLQPKDPQGQDLLAVVYFRLGMYPRAITILERLKAQSPHEPALMLSLSLCYLKTAQPARARDELSALVAMNPGHARAWGYLGLAYERLGDMERARAAWHAARTVIDTQVDHLRGDTAKARFLATPGVVAVLAQVPVEAATLAPLLDLGAAPSDAALADLAGFGEIGGLSQSVHGGNGNAKHTGDRLDVDEIVVVLGKCVFRHELLQGVGFLPSQGPSLKFI